MRPIAFVDGKSEKDGISEVLLMDKDKEVNTEWTRSHFNLKATNCSNRKLRSEQPVTELDSEQLEILTATS
jgi:hypothetical protein